MAKMVIEPETVRCECAAWSGHRCLGVGDTEDTLVVEWMPVHLRASHVAAGNRGSYPHNGARRLRVRAFCAQAMLADDGEWCDTVATS